MEKSFISKLFKLITDIQSSKKQISDIDYKTYICLLNSDECSTYIYNNGISKELTDEMFNCVKYASNEQLYLDILINKICNSEKYNKRTIDLLNSDINFLLKMIKTNPTVINYLHDKDEKYYLNLIIVIDMIDVIKIFKSIPFQSLEICKIAINKDYDVIKYINVQSEDLCKMALLKGHNNLKDIKPQYHTKAICRNYLKLNKQNIMYLTNESKISEDVILKLLDENLDYFKILDDSLKTSNMCEYVVSKNGLFIEYVPIYYQNMRIITIAKTQHPHSKYYVTYRCTEIFDEIELTNAFKEHIFETFKDKLISDFVVMINKFSKYLIYVKHNNIELFMMTVINYINFKMQNEIKNNEPNLFENVNLDIITETIFNDVVKHKKFVSKLNDKQIETSEILYDSYGNIFIVVKIESLKESS